jgi:hypothetical protein
MGIERAYRPEHWRKRAEEMRAKADNCEHRQTRNTLLRAYWRMLHVHERQRIVGLLKIGSPVVRGATGESFDARKINNRRSAAQRSRRAIRRRIGGRKSGRDAPGTFTWCSERK